MLPRILYEDIHLCVLSKPAGLLSQSDISGEASLVDLLRTHFGRNYVGLVHRLDRNTTGLMVVAKRSKAADRLTQALQKGTLTRRYLAWVHGSLDRPARWEHWLKKDERDNVVSVVSAGNGKKAALQVTPVARSQATPEPLTLARFELETGRSHQIRAQAAAEGFPLLGDKKYGKKMSSVNDRGASGRVPFGRPALHSAELAFPHPMSGEEMRFEDPLPPDMAAIPQAPLSKSNL